jgi:hypothetical protein
MLAGCRFQKVLEAIEEFLGAFPGTGRRRQHLIRRQLQLFAKLHYSLRSPGSIQLVDLGESEQRRDLDTFEKLDQPTVRTGHAVPAIDQHNEPE